MTDNINSDDKICWILHTFNFKRLNHVIINSLFIADIFLEHFDTTKLKQLIKKLEMLKMPLSLISSFSKLFEILITNQLTEYFKSYSSLFDNNQHGF